jgi:hypothetical protein
MDAVAIMPIERRGKGPKREEKEDGFRSAEVSRALGSLGEDKK